MYKANLVKPAHKYSADIYQSIAIYQSGNRLLSWYFWKRVSEIVSVTLGHLPDPKSAYVLDLGCGSGFPLPTMENNYGRVAAVDIFPDQARLVAEREGLKTEVYKADGKDLPFSDSTFDVILLMDILEHVTGDKQLVIDECLRVLKPGGLIACSMPVEVGPVLFVRQLGRRVFGLGDGYLDIKDMVRFGLSTNASDPTRSQEVEYHQGPHDDHAHKGYNYLEDIRLLNKSFQELERIGVPFRHIKSLSPTIIYLGKNLSRPYHITEKHQQGNIAPTAANFMSAR